MKLNELLTENEQPGTYAGVRFDRDTIDALEKFVKDNNIPNGHDDWHTTLLYSRKHLPEYKPAGEYPEPMNGTASGFEMFGEDKNILVLTYSCPELSKRHKELMDEHDAEFDFDEYRPHITLSYDPQDVTPDDLPGFSAPITIIKEYSEDLDAD